MFWIMKKDKIIAFIISVATVFTLVFIGSLYENGHLNLVPTVTTVTKQLPIYSVNTNEKKVALTMNCAWNADDVDTILQVLNNTNTKITFFMVGDWVDKYPEAVRKIFDQGHEIANHSDGHKHVNSISYEENISEIQKCSDKIEKITGNKTNLYRGPYGEYNDTVIKAARELNHITIQWSIDTLDYKSLTGEQMWERIKTKLSNGSIILTHNGTENTALSLEMIINNIRKEGFEVTTVSNIIFKENYTIDNNGVQNKNI